MAAPTLDRLAELWRMAPIQGPTGEVSNEWELEISCFAKKEQPAPGNRFQSDGVTARTITSPTVLIRWVPELAEGQDFTKWELRMTQTGERFRILSSAEEFGRMNYLRLIVETNNGLPA